jgi:hypothetical protein
MSNSNQNSKLTDPRHLQMAEKYQEKFSDKEAYEESDITGWSGVGVFCLHAIIALGSVMAIYYLNISKAEKAILSCFVVVLAGVLEYFKSVYMERFFISKLKSLNVKLSKDTRLMHQKKMGVAKTILMCFWGASVVIFMAGGIQYATNNMGNVEKLEYDQSLKASLNAKTKALESARLNGAGSGRLRQLAEDQTIASTAWQNHKTQVETRQAALNTDGESSTWTWGLIALVICAGLECGLFFLRGFHEGEQYKIALSLMEDGADVPLDLTASPTPSVSKEVFDAMAGKSQRLFNENQILEQKHISIQKELEILKQENTRLQSKNDALERLVK